MRFSIGGVLVLWPGNWWSRISPGVRRNEKSARCPSEQFDRCHTCPITVTKNRRNKCANKYWLDRIQTESSRLSQQSTSVEPRAIQTVRVLQRPASRNQCDQSFLPRRNHRLSGPEPARCGKF